MLTVPPALLDVLGLKPEMAVALSVRGGKLLVEPQTRRRYSLDELLAQCDPKAPLPPEQREWIDAPAVGGEIVT